MWGGGGGGGGRRDNTLWEVFLMNFIVLIVTSLSSIVLGCVSLWGSLQGNRSVSDLSRVRLYNVRSIEENVIRTSLCSSGEMKVRDSDSQFASFYSVPWQQYRCVLLFSAAGSDLVEGLTFLGVATSLKLCIALLCAFCFLYISWSTFKGASHKFTCCLKT